MRKIFSTLILACLFSCQFVQAQGPNEIILYADANFGGQSVTITVGTYPNISALGFPNNTASSIKVGSNVVAVLHSCVDFGGGYSNGFRAYSANDADFSNDNWPQGQNCGGSTPNNNVNALWVMSKNCVPGANEVSFYDNPNYLGGCVTAPVGSYITPTLAGMPNDWAGSLKVGSNVSVKIWADEFQGTNATYGQGASAATLAIGNNQISSFVVDGCPNDPNKIAPGVCGCGVADTDTDNDGTADCKDGCPNDPNKIAPGICGCGVADTDTDNDGTADCNDGCPNDPNKIAPGICGCGVADTDTDNDGTADCNDGCPNDPNKIAPGICGCGVADTDTDNDGTADCNDGCPNDPNKIAPGICGCGVADTDTDNDGTADCNDGCPNDPNKIAPGVCGCGVADTDTDNDGTADCNDGCPNDPNKIAPGICGCGVADTDTDNDGTADCHDGCPNDPNKIAPGACGCGVADKDTDCDGVADCNDICPGGNDSVDNNHDGIPDCSQVLPYSQYLASWKCGNNKINICHVDQNGNRNTLCVSINALPAHLGHGDWAGPCIGCARSAPSSNDGSNGELQMELYPNPSSGILTIDLSGLEAAGKGVLSISDPMGRVVYEQKFEAGVQSLQIDFAKQNLSSGEYFVRVESNAGVVVRKLSYH